MTVIERGGVPEPGGVIAPPLPLTRRTPRAPGLGEWVARIPEAFRVPGWRRVFACWALLGALTDMGTTMLLGRVDGIYEANPLSAAGQELVGSVSGYMVATTLVVCAIVTVLAVKPVGIATHLVWWAVAGLGIAKIGVAVLNLVVLQGALTASIDRL